MTTMISNMMVSLLERLAEMFPAQSYQSRLDNYLKSKHITDPGQLDHYIRQFDSKKEPFL